jgi:hypothetical protein
MLAVHCAACDINGDGGIRRPRRSPKTHFLSFKVAEVLIDGESRHGGERHCALVTGAPRRSGYHTYVPQDPR